MAADALFARCSPAVVSILTFDAEGPAGFGSGFIVSADGFVVTNYHVIRGAELIVVASESNRGLIFDRVCAIDEESDLALLKVMTQGLPSLEVSTAEPAVGTKVYAIGNPQGFSNTLSDGLVSGIRRQGAVTFLQTTAANSPGSSGGPLLTPLGRVVGVTTMYFNQGQNLNFAVPGARVVALIERNNRLGQTTYDPAPEPRAGPGGYADPAVKVDDERFRAEHLRRAQASDKKRAEARRAVNALLLQWLGTWRGKDACRINGQLLFEGQRIGEITVTEISVNSVTLMTRGFTFTLYVEPRPKPVSNSPAR